MGKLFYFDSWFLLTVWLVHREIKLQEREMYKSSRISIALIFLTLAVEIEFKLSPTPSRQWTPNIYTKNSK